MKWFVLKHCFSWNHPEWGLLSPGEFLPVAEKYGFMGQIDHWVLKEACNQIGKWKKLSYQTVPISLNVSPERFSEENMSSLVEKTIYMAGISSS